MRKILSLFLLLGLTATACIGWTRAQNLNSPIAGAVDLIPPTMVPAGYNPGGGGGWNTNVVAVKPSGVVIRGKNRFMGVVDANLAGNAANATLDVWFQASVDGVSAVQGTSDTGWTDIAHVQYNGSVVGVRYIPFSVRGGDGANYPTAPVLCADATTTANSIQNYAFGDRVRAKYKVTWPQGNTGSVMFHVYMIPD